MEDVRLLKVPEVAAVLSVSRSVVYELMASGRITSVSIGRARRVSVQALESFLNDLSQGAHDA